MKTQVLALACLVPCVFLAASAPPPAEPPPVAVLIRLLGDDNYQRREMASRRLVHRADAIPALQAALAHRDAEVRRRATRLLRNLRGWQQTEALVKADLMLNSGYCDCAIELLMRFVKGPAMIDRLPTFYKFASRLLREEQGSTKVILHRHSKNELYSNHRSYLTQKRPVIVSPKPIIHKSSDGSHGSIVLTSSFQSSSSNVNNFLLLATDTVRTVWIFNSIIIANGSVTANKVEDSIIVSDDEVTIREACGNSIIIARKGIRCGKREQLNVMISGGRITFARPKSNRTVSKPNATSFLGVKFFNLIRNGLDTRDTAAGPVVKSVTKGSCFAGKLQPGDAITAVDSKAVSTHEALRKILRPHFAEQTAFTLTLKRGKQSLKVRIEPKP